jgi:hypothetical protein
MGQNIPFTEVTLQFPTPRFLTGRKENAMSRILAKTTAAIKTAAAAQKRFFAEVGDALVADTPDSVKCALVAAGGATEGYAAETLAPHIEPTKRTWDRHDGTKGQVLVLNFGNGVTELVDVDQDGPEVDELPDLSKAWNLRNQADVMNTFSIPTKDWLSFHSKKAWFGFGLAMLALVAHTAGYMPWN